MKQDRNMCGGMNWYSTSKEGGKDVNICKANPAAGKDNQ
jgi:hypothetical protein